MDNNINIFDRLDGGFYDQQNFSRTVNTGPDFFQEIEEFNQNRKRVVVNIEENEKRKRNQIEDELEIGIGDIEGEVQMEVGDESSESADEILSLCHEYQKIMTKLSEEKKTYPTIKALVEEITREAENIQITNTFDSIKTHISSNSRGCSFCVSKWEQWKKTLVECKKVEIGESGQLLVCERLQKVMGNLSVENKKCVTSGELVGRVYLEAVETGVTLAKSTVKNHLSSKLLGCPSCLPKWRQLEEKLVVKEVLGESGQPLLCEKLQKIMEDLSEKGQTYATQGPLIQTIYLEAEKVGVEQGYEAIRAHISNEKHCSPCRKVWEKLKKTVVIKEGIGESGKPLLCESLEEVMDNLSQQTDKKYITIQALLEDVTFETNKKINKTIHVIRAHLTKKDKGCSSCQKIWRPLLKKLDLK